MCVLYPEELGPAPAPGCTQWMGPQQVPKNLWGSQQAEGLYYSHICSLLWGWSTGLYTPHFPSLTLLGKVLYLLCQVFQSRKTLEYCIPFFTILYFQSLNIEELLNLESSKLSVLFLVILAGFPTKCCVFVTGNGMEHSESVNNNKMSSAFRNIVWAYSSSNIFLIPVCNFIDISTGPMTVTNSIGEASYTL